MSQKPALFAQERDLRLRIVEDHDEFAHEALPDDSSVGSTKAYPYSAGLDGIPGRIPSYHLLSLL